MKERMLGLIVGLLLIGFNGFAADGDLIVNGNVGIGGQSNPSAPLYIYKAVSGATQPRIIVDNGQTGKGRITAFAGVAPRIDLSANMYYNGSNFYLDDTTYYGGRLSIAPTTAASGALLRLGYITPGTNPRTYADVMYVDYNGNVGIGTTSPGNILTVLQYSATDPIADSWTTHPCDRTTKEVIRTLPNQSGALDRLLEVELYEWKRKPLVSDDEIRSRFGEDIGLDELERKRQELSAEKSNLPKFQARRLGIMLDDPNIPDEIVVLDGAGNKKGIDLVGYIGWLHVTIKELALRVQELEKR